MVDNNTASANIPEPPPPAPTQSKSDEKERLNKDALLNAINISWCFGFNKHIGAHNLCVNNSKKMFLCSSHIGIVYNFDTNEQHLLQGHRNSITCVTVSDDKRWLVTADAGVDSTIIIWDLNSNLPVQTYFNTHLEGTVAVAMSPDSKFIASLSAQHPQVLAIWEWTTDSEVPVCSVELHDRFGLQSYIRFDPSNASHIVTNSVNQALFYEWDAQSGFQYFAPVLNDQTFNRPVGRLTQSIFQLQKGRALTGTTLGNLVVWQVLDEKSHICDKKAFKLFKLQEKGINVLTTTNDIIVIGDADGELKFIDQNLHVIMWYKHFKLGPINKISFTQITKDYKMNEQNEGGETDATILQKKFICKNFLITSNTANIAYVTKTCTKIDIVLNGSDSAINAVVCHPTLPRVCFGNSSGFMQLWDYQKHTLICSRIFAKNMAISRLCYDQQGDYIVVGFANGNLQIIDSLTLSDVLNAPFTYGKDSVTHISFSHDSSYLATAEADYTISVYVRNYGNNASGNELYTILGRFRSHYKPIVGLLFGIMPDTNETRLMSLGQDRVLIEYDLANSNFDDLKIKDTTRIEQYGIPLSILWYPAITKESFFLTFTDQWKFKLYNSSTNMCRKTLLGPTFGSLLQKVLLIPKENNLTEKRYLAYITHDKLGIQKLPLTGNPFDSIAIYAHPDGVTDVVSSYDGKYLFTSGGKNNNVFMWRINFESLEAQSILGGPDLQPFYGLLDGGREGPLFKEMTQLFYYSQLRHQGLNANEEREIKLTIPLSEIPFVMRGLGFYPTEQEIDDMMNEVKFSQYVHTNEYVEAIDLNDFIRLYINHRPAFGLDPHEIYRSFKILSRNKKQEIARPTFVNHVQTTGEHMTTYELADCLSNLLHLNLPVDEMSIEESTQLLNELLPESMNVDTFMTHLMGVPKESFNDILQTWEDICRMNSPRKSGKLHDAAAEYLPPQSPHESDY